MRPILLHNNWHLIILFVLCPDLIPRNNQVSATRRGRQGHKVFKVDVFSELWKCKETSRQEVLNIFYSSKKLIIICLSAQCWTIFFNATSSKTSSVGRVIVTSGKWFCGRATLVDSAEVKYNKQRLCLSPILNRHRFIFQCFCSKLERQKCCDL